MAKEELISSRSQVISGPSTVIDRSADFARQPPIVAPTPVQQITERPAPFSSFRIPRVATVDRSEEEQSVFSEDFSDVDLTRMEVRQQWLSHVRNILIDVPMAEPTPEPNALGTHVKSLAPKAKRLKMPVLPEVKQVIQESVEKPKRDFHK